MSDTEYMEISAERDRLRAEIAQKDERIAEYERTLDYIADLYERCMYSSVLEVSQHAYDMRCLARAALEGDTPKISIKERRIAELEAEITRLRAVIAKLEKALEPLALVIDERTPDHEILPGYYRASDVRRATTLLRDRAALAPKGDD